MNDQTTGTVSKRTRLSYGFGCIGRDMAYTLVSMWIMTYLTLAVGLTNWQLAAIGVIMVIGRVWDAVNDPIMGTIIDNTHTRFGKFKPYIIIGAVLNSFFIVLMFTDLRLSETLFIVVFAISYLLWDLTFTMNDISYWSMLPSLTTNPKEREKITSLARIGANIGLFVVTAAVSFITQLGKMSDMYFILAVGICTVFIACQLLVVIGVQEKKNAITAVESHTSLIDMVKIIFKNDQLLAIIISMLLFNIGYFTTTAFGVQFFYFDYGVYGGPEFTIFAITIGVSQIFTLAFYPLFAKNMSRPQLFKLSIGLVLLGYAGFMAVGYILPMNMVVLCIIGFILFAGQAIIQLLNYVLLADTIEYGQWKLGTRNESVIFSLNPFITKMASAVEVGIFSFTLLISGINGYSNQISELEKSTTLTQEQIKMQAQAVASSVPDSATMIMRISMIVLPLILIVISYWVYRRFYKIDDKMYTQIIADLNARAQSEN